MTPIEILMHEHRVIETALDCLDRLADTCEARGELPTQLASRLLGFLRDYADHCHHGKEEEMLFPLMESKGFSRRGGPTGVMFYEHDLGRELVRTMADDIAQQSATGFAPHARQFANLLRLHIQKEDHCLFQMAEQALTASEQQMLDRSFAAFESDPRETARRDQALDTARDLAGQLGVPTSSIDNPHFTG